MERIRAWFAFSRPQVDGGPDIVARHRSFGHVYMTMKRVVLLSMFLLGPSPS